MGTGVAAVGTRGPIEIGARIHALDALRGIALLGILIANVRQMFLPWDVADFPVAMGGSQTLAWLDGLLFEAFVSQKFLTVFSMLFGIGFALQAQRLSTRGEGFSRIYLRRVVCLALFGVVHALFLYPAEVLLPYATTALLLLAAHNLAPATLFRLGLVLLGATALWAYQIGSLGKVYVLTSVATIVALAASLWILRRGAWSGTLIAWAAIVVAGGGALTLQFHADPAAAAAESSVAREYREAQEQLAALQADEASAWPLEYRVRRAASFAALVELHASQYTLILFYFAVLLLWRTLGLFMIGVAVYRGGLLASSSEGIWRRIAFLGIGIGLPVSALGTVLGGFESAGRFDLRFPELLHELGSLPFAAGIAGATFLWHARSTRRWLWERVEATGRMALTNYIGQSLVMAALAEPWGLGWYGRFGGPTLTVLAVAVFAALALLSHAWLSRFRMGPLEWLWRCATYWRWLPVRST